MVETHCGHFPYATAPSDPNCLWPDGPWTHEDSQVAWIDSRTNLHCAMIRHPDFGTWLGYVGVPEGHPLHGKAYGEQLQIPITYAEQFMQRSVDIDRDIGIMNLFCAVNNDPVTTGFIEITLALPAHGGISYSAQDDDQGWWWFGFDCMHHGDRSPIGWPIPGGVYRDQGYVYGVVTRLAWALEELRQVIEGDFFNHP